MADDATLSLYDRDFYLWTQTEAEKLRARIGRDNALDYENLAEEVADLGSEQRNKVKSWVRLIIEHLYKLHATRRREPVGHWVGEIGNFRADAENTLTPSIKRLVQHDLEALHVKAARLAAKRFSLDEPEAEIDPALRWTWAEIMGEADDPLDQDFPLKS
jgi:hypothetical protein